MIRKILVGLMAFSVAACGGTSQGYDGYIFGKKQYEKKAVVTVVVTYKSKMELRAAARKYVKDGNYDLTEAFSVVSPNSNVCTVHMMDPAVEYQPEFIGHEFAHCLYGQWHTDNNSRA